MIPTWLQTIRCLLFDVDGVLYRGSQPLPGAREIVLFLEERDLPYMLLTNNATGTPAQYAAKLAAMGIPVPAERIFTSGEATALYLKKQEPAGAPVYVIGEAGLIEPLERAGFWRVERGARYVCVGLDRQLTYEKLKRACLEIRAGARFIASNPDTTLPTEEGIVPGNGATLAALVACTDVRPTVIGKPEATMLLLAIERLGVSPAETLIIGDRWDTDLLAGHRAGTRTVLVLTGIHQPADLVHSPVQPDLIVDDLVVFRQMLAEAWAESPETR